MRLILIDNGTGYIFGDSADFAGGRAMESASDAARQLDASIGVFGRAYVEQGPCYRPAANEAAYHVYRADDLVRFPPVEDGQDGDTIAFVESLCDKVAIVLCRDAAED